MKFVFAYTATLLLLLSFPTAPIQAQSPYAKNTALFGLSYTIRTDLPQDPDLNNLSINAGYFVIDKLNTGLDLGMSGTVGHREMGVGPYARYYILNKRVTPLLDAAYHFQTINAHGSPIASKGYAHLLNLGGGVSYNGLMKRWGLELLGEQVFENAYIRSVENPDKRLTVDNWFQLRLRLVYYLDQE